jgi:hypothetical protein
VRKRNIARLAVVGAAAAALPMIVAGQAFADYAPQAGDVVGIGGDTPQYAIDFLINGDTAGDSGFDQTAGVNRVIPFDATADANGRQAYAQGSTEASPVPLNPTVVLRAGHSPVQRPQSSGDAITAIENDKGTTEVINYVASASLPGSNNGVTGGFHRTRRGQHLDQCTRGFDSGPTAHHLHDRDGHLGQPRSGVVDRHHHPGDSAGNVLGGEVVLGHAEDGERERHTDARSERPDGRAE